MDRGTSSRRNTSESTRITTRVPTTTDFKMRIKSGIDAKRQNPRYIPNNQKKTDWTGIATTSILNALPRCSPGISPRLKRSQREKNNAVGISSMSCKNADQRLNNNLITTLFMVF